MAEKDSYWFRHDSTAGRGLRMRKMAHIYGHWGKGIYWDVIEILRDQSNYCFDSDDSSLQMLCDLIGCKDESKFMNWFRDCVKFELFIIHKNKFFSEVLCKNMNNWEIKKHNGSKGGRPNKTEIETETETELKANEKLNDKLNESIREENRIKDNIIKDNIIKDNNNKFDFKKSLINYGFLENLVLEWVQVRKNKKLTNTETSFNRFILEVEKIEKVPINEILSLCVEKSWGGFNADWYFNEKNKNNGTNRQQSTNSAIIDFLK